MLENLMQMLGIGGGQQSGPAPNQSPIGGPVPENMPMGLSGIMQMPPEPRPKGPQIVEVFDNFPLISSTEHPERLNPLLRRDFVEWAYKIAPETPPHQLDSLYKEYTAEAPRIAKMHQMKTEIGQAKTPEDIEAIMNKFNPPAKTMDL